MNKLRLFSACSLTLLSIALQIAWAQGAGATLTPTSTRTLEHVQTVTGTPDAFTQTTVPLNFPTLSAPTPSEDAQTAISLFNQNRLGGTMQVVYAGNLTNTILPVLQLLPASIQMSMLNSIGVSSVSYWGLLNSGVAMVAIGDCASDHAFCTVTADNLSDQLSSASTGIYAIVVNEVAATAPEAATLIRAAFPRVNQLLLNPIDNIEIGFAFSAVTTNTGYDFYNRTSISVPEAVYAGAIPYGSGRTLVYALVALGEGYVKATAIEGVKLNLR